MTLASTINDSLNAVTWTYPYGDDHVVYYFGTLFNKVPASDFQLEIDEFIEQNSYDYDCYAMELLHHTWQFAFPSSDLIASAKTLLNQVDMLGATHSPHTYTTASHDYVHMYDRYFWFGYALSRALNYLQTKWDSRLAWQELKDVFAANSGQGVLYGDPRDNTYASWNRTYDEHLQSLDWLLRMYEVNKKNNAGALTYAVDTLWAYINTNGWNPSPGHWRYTANGTSTGYECEGAFIPQIALRLYNIYGSTLPNFDRVTTDLKNRFITNEWNSPQWMYGATNYYVVVHKNDTTSQRRLHNTMGAWVSLHMYYQLLDSTSQTHIQNLLDGSTKAWEYLVSATPGLYDSGTKKFRMVSDVGLSDAGTCVGIGCLWLMGIVPQTGSLYIPTDEARYECGYGEALLRYFKFDYANRRIKIPVKAGTLKFIYGTTSVTGTFSEDGVYEVLFNDDWTKISRATRLYGLDDKLMYVNSPASTDVDTSERRSFASAIMNKGEQVTRRELVLLHFRDPTTGWYAKDYVESSIYMWILTKNMQKQALSLGTYVKRDALGATVNQMREGDQIKTSKNVYYEVEAVNEGVLEGRVFVRLCDLVELSMYEEED